MKIVTVREEDRFEDDFKDPAKYFIIDAMGDAVYFKTNSRAKAQEEADKLYGKNKFTVRIAMRAAVR